MLIKSIRSIQGPNVFHHKPVLIMDLELEGLTEVSSADIPRFTERLLAFLPGLGDHRCSPGRKGGFVERLHRGTYFAHIVEHIALELSRQAGIEVFYGKSIYGGSPGHYQVIVRYKCEAGMREILKLAVDIAASVAAGDDKLQLREPMERIKRLISENTLGPSTRAILSAAEAKGIPYIRMNEHSLVQLGYGRYRTFIQATTTGLTSDISVDLAQDKFVTKDLLQAASIPVPKGRVVYGDQDALKAFHEIGAPVAIKPLDGNHGRGVTLGVTNEDQVLQAFRLAAAHSDRVLVEQSIEGRDYRILLVGGKFLAAAERRPASVTGDGKLTIKELIDKENQNEKRGIGHEKPMTKILIDQPLEQYLKNQGLSLSNVPEPGHTIRLRETANLSTGGSAADVTEIVHPQVKLLCERAARIVGLDVCGIDFISSDISLPLEKQTGGIIEVNAGPGIRMHHYPSEGKPRDVGGAILDMLFPPPSQGRIPILSITGTNGKTTVTRVLSHIFSEPGRNVGMATTDGIFINGELTALGDTTGPYSARSILADPGIDLAVLETARGGIVRRGLGYDWSDVGVITNIEPDHIGQDGIESVEDILRIKSLVAERVRPGGSVILNGDDPLLLNYSEKVRDSLPGRELILFSLHHDSEAVQRQRARKGAAYYVKNGWLVELKSGVETPVVRSADLPFTFCGTASFQTANALAGMAAARAAGGSMEKIRAGLRSFLPNVHNSGRTNFYRIGGGHLLLDYGHNPHALHSVAQMIKSWKHTKKTAVIAVPGDRSDDLIRESGFTAAKGFDSLIIREDVYLRGRRPGEVAKILQDAVKAVNPGLPCDVVLCPREALRRPLASLRPGELLIYFYDELNAISDIISESGAHPELPSEAAISKEASPELLQVS